MRPYLVFCSTAGKQAAELFGADREFDVCLHHYAGDNEHVPLKEDELLHWMPDDIWSYKATRGEKLNVAARVIPKLPPYRQYCFLDDDITVNTYNLNRLFRVGDALRLPLYQPSLTKGSYGSYPHLFQIWDTQCVGALPIRSVPLVEIMCPFFSADALHLCKDTFDINESGWGLDCYLWPKIVNGQTFVIDSIPVGHYREPSRRTRILRNGLTCQQELWIQQVINNPETAPRNPPGLAIPLEDVEL